jgi:hypothetical protein
MTSWVDDDLDELEAGGRGYVGDARAVDTRPEMQLIGRGNVMRSRSKFQLVLRLGRLAGRGRASIALAVCGVALVAACVLGFLAPAGAAASTTHSKSSSAGQTAATGDLHATGVGAPDPTIQTQVSVDGVVGGTVPPPPADAIGTPAESTLVQSDQLYMTKIDADGSTSNQWATVDPSKTDTGGIGDHGGYGQESARPLLNANVATAAGRFLDPVTARVLSLKLTTLGSDGLLTLSSANQTADPEWGTKPVSSCGAGDTCAFVANSLQNNDGISWTVNDSAQAPVPVGVVGSGGPSGQPATGQQWTVIDAGGGFDQLVNKSDGLCLMTTDGYSVLADACDDPATAAANQLWKITPAAGAGPRSSGQPVVEISPKAYPGVFVSVQIRNNTNIPTGRLDLEPQGGSSGTPGTQLFDSDAVSEPDGAIPTWSTVIPNADPATPYALASGDLDRVVGADGNYHDEAVVAYAGAAHHLQVRVIDYNANSSHLLVTAPDQQLPVIGAISGLDGQWYPGNVGVAVGSFDGGALNQIAVTWQDAGGQFHVTLLAYRKTDGGGRALTVLGDPAGITLFPDAKTRNDLASGYDQTTAGDFEGIGRDDLAIAYAGKNPDGSNEDSGHLGVVSFTSDLKVRGQTTFQFSTEAGLYTQDTAETSSSHGVRVVPGLFRFDPGQGYGFGRRELAVAWTEQPDLDLIKDRVQALDVEPSPGCSDSSCDLTIKPLTPVHDLRDENPAGGDTLPISLSAGGFAGQGDGSDPPLWDIVVALPPLASGSHGRIVVEKMSASDASKDVPADFSAEDVSYTDPDTRLVLTAYDREGNSLAVGAPLLVTLTKLVKGNIIAAQPPAHSDWLPTPAHPEGEIVNVSRNSGFAVTMSTSTTKQYDYTYTTKPGWDLGVTQGFKTSGSIGIGDENNHGTVDWSGEEKFAKNWSETDATFNKYSSTITTTVTTTGTDDDIVQGLMQTYYIYKYPILGQLPKKPDGSPVFPTDCSGQPCQPIYEVTIPGQALPADGLGRDLDFYQPSWENGNALSYPALVDGKLPLPDLGSYYYYDEHGNKVDVKAPLVDDTIDVGGAKSTHNLVISNQTGGGHETDTANNWELGDEFSLGVSGKWDFAGLYGNASVSVSGGVSGGKTFASTDSGSSGSTESDSFELDIPTIDSNKAYKIATAYYYDQSGAQKVVHGVDLTASAAGRDWWLRNYGQHPDPALNLPDATFLTYDDLGILDKVLFNADATRQLIRGFYALQPVNPDSPLTSGVPYATDPQAGDPVTFSVQVHNYSLVDSDAVPVDFYAVPVDPQGLNPTGPPQEIGEVESLPIPAQGVKTVDSPTWTAKAAGDGQQNWRIFVVLDPDNLVHEIHPWKGGIACPADDIDPDAPVGTVVDGKMVDPMTGQPETLACGQNNQGYGTITVMPNATTGLGATAPPNTTSTNGTQKHHRHHHHHQTTNPNMQLGVTAPGGATGPTEPDGSRLQDSTILTGDSDNNLLLSSPDTIPSVHLGDMVTGVIHTTTSADTDAIQPVLIYDGPPSQGHPIAETTVDGATTHDGGYATFTWIADTPGLHTFYEKMLGTDPTEDSSDTMQVNVLP